MRDVILLFTLFVGLGLQAQPHDWFAPVGATWTYYSNIYPLFPADYSNRPYFQAKVVKDSVIMGKSCRKVMAFEADGSPRPNSTVWLYTDSTSIYTLHEDSFRVFFDTSLAEGDTFKYYTAMNYQVYDYLCCGLGEEVKFQLVVDSVRMIELDGINLKRWYTSYIDIHPGEPEFFLSYTEKLGGFPLFGRTEACCAIQNNQRGYFHCYEDQTTFINTDTVDCTYPVGIESPETGSIQIAPNPTSGQIEITLPTSFDPASSRALIYSLDGRLIRVADLNTKITTLKLDFPAGLYLVQVQMGGRQYMHQLSVIR